MLLRYCTVRSDGEIFVRIHNLTSSLPVFFEISNSVTLSIQKVCETGQNQHTNSELEERTRSTAKRDEQPEM